MVEAAAAQGWVDREPDHPRDAHRHPPRGRRHGAHLLGDRGRRVARRATEPLMVGPLATVVVLRRAAARRLGRRARRASTGCPAAGCCAGCSLLQLLVLVQAGIAVAKMVGGEVPGVGRRAASATCSCRC